MSEQEVRLPDPPDGFTGEEFDQVAVALAGILTSLLAVTIRSVGCTPEQGARAIGLLAETIAENAVSAGDEQDDDDGDEKGGDDPE